MIYNSLPLNIGMSTRKNISNLTCPCHSKLTDHPCGACGQLGHHRPLCDLLQNARKTQKPPCKLCPGRAHVTENHYCQFCTHQPMAGYYCEYLGQPNFIVIHWNWICGRNFPQGDLKPYVGHSHVHCPKLKELRSRVNLTDFFTDFRYILENERKRRRYNHLDGVYKHPAGKNPTNEFLNRIHYWRHIPCLSYWYQDLARLFSRKNMAIPRIQYLLLLLFSMFLNRSALLGKPEHKLMEHCDCSQDYINMIIIKFIFYLYHK